MGENHLTYFKIENFKRFDSFEMENLGQYNLLVGDNNVGKTSVLEGLLFRSEGDTCLANLFQTLLYRKLFFVDKKKVLANLNDENLWKFILKNIDKTLQVNNGYGDEQEIINWEIVEHQTLTESDWNAINKKGYRNDGVSIFKKGVRISSEYAEKDKKYYPFSYNFYPFSRTTNEEIEMNWGYMPFIPTNLGYDFDLLDFYYKKINADKDLRKEFDSNLKTFIPKLEETRTQKMLNDIDFICVSLEDDNGLYPITRFGDGVVKLVRVLLEILMAKGKRLMIDEIETGIHFSRLKEFWKTVITLCKKYDVQLFATTHSLECQKYFVYALAELGEDFQNDARNISLVEDTNGDVKSVTFDFNQFEFAMEIGYNTRGGI
ncbi:AAA15 family ATPase/GTPase [Arcicella aurantiaca]|uniref:AAA15 family ATPase/GTPase n=1 Tax=Arcicella aurantiaca TaxID=591202 RepID=A0A316EHS4_9BACT|nr:AAA family ATPase [Arcicella aurantiaca]PWK29357.1 AAA15 family ATPase/GTPase [Arcicella aurantiaca]